MPAKSKSPEAAQKKFWKAEIREHHRAITKLQKDRDKEERRLSLEIKKLVLAIQKLSGTYHRESAAKRRRIAILQGRIGL